MQITVRKAQIKGKSEKLVQIVEQRIFEALDRGIDYLSTKPVPVDTGAYARSMHLNPRGDRSGLGESSARKQRGVDQNQELNDMESRLAESLGNLELLDGATFINNAPHADKVELRDAIFARLKNVIGAPQK